MRYELVNCTDGKAAPRKTELEIELSGGVVTFTYTAHESELFCCDPGYNNIHSLGDVCEILIGTDPERKSYYEIEINPIGDLMIANMHYCGTDDVGSPILDINFVKEPFIDAKTKKTADGYVARLSFALKDINSGEGEVYFNAYRIETDGGEPEKHLLALIPAMQGKFHVPSKFVFLKDYV